MEWAESRAAVEGVKMEMGAYDGVMGRASVIGADHG